MARRERSGKRSSRGKERSSGKSSSRRSSSKRSFTYKKRDAESVKKRSTQNAGNRDQIFLGDNVYKVKDDNNIRILPPTWDDPEHYAFDVYVHYGIGPDESAFVCLDKIDSDEPCPICEERSKAEADGDTEYASELKPTKRPTCYVIDRDNEEEGPLLWSMPWTVDRDLSAQSFDKKTGEVIPLDDPYDGFDVSFGRTGKGMKTKYVGLSIGRHSSEASDDLDEVLEQIQETPVPEALDVKDADYIAGVFSGHSNKSSGKDKDGGDGDLPTWEEVHDLDFSELEDLVEEEDLDTIDPDDFDEEDELADAICEELDIDKPKKSKKEGKKRSGSMRRNKR